jgi:hypothetical protein
MPRFGRRRTKPARIIKRACPVGAGQASCAFEIGYQNISIRLMRARLTSITFQRKEATALTAAPARAW